VGRASKPPSSLTVTSDEPVLADGSAVNTIVLNKVNNKTTTDDSSHASFSSHTLLGLASIEPLAVYTCMSTSARETGATVKIFLHRSICKLKSDTTGVSL
jgi:hypothetical protein